MIVMPYRFALLLVAGGLVAFAAFVACSSDPAADGASCEDDDGCKSGVCVEGTCGGRACACPTCANECDEGWECSTRGALPGLSCARTCTTSSDCPAGTHCSVNVCASGKEISLSWVKQPGQSICPLAAPCAYEVSASGPGAGDIASWTWTFGDAGVGDAEATIEYAYPTPGTYEVVVTPALKSGHTGPQLTASEHVCINDPEAECRPGSNDCCGGSCSLDSGRCR
jgi:hypothetical protein